MSRIFAKQKRKKFVYKSVVVSFTPLLEEKFLRNRLLLPSPRKEFSESLRKKILLSCESENLLSEFPLPHPCPEFTRMLRAKLLLSTRAPSSLHIFSRFSPKKIVRFSRTFSGIAVAILLFFGTLPAFFSSSTLATEGTRLSDFQGEVIIVRDGGAETVATNDIFLGSGAIIETKEDSFAEIRFFEDSVLRLDQNTRVKIELLTPHRARSDLGHIQVFLESGRAWVRSFSTETDFSEFSLRINGAAILSKNGAAIEAITDSSERTFLVHDRSARLFANGTEYFLPAGKSWSSDSEMTISSFSESDEWAQHNLAADRVLAEALIQEKIVAQKEGFLASLRDIFVFQTETEKMFFEIVSSSFDHRDISEYFVKFSKRVRDDFAKNPESTRAFLAAAQKNLVGILPDSPLFSLKTQMENLGNDLENIPAAVAAESKKTTRLWEARDLAAQGKTELAAEIVSETVSEEIPNPLPGIEILEEKTEQIAAIAEIPETQAEEDKIIAELPRLGLQGLSRPKGDPVKTAQDIVRRVKIYESESGQENTLRFHLKEVSDLATLVEIRRRLPENLAEIVNEKIFVVLNLETKKTKSEPIL